MLCHFRATSGRYLSFPSYTYQHAATLHNWNRCCCGPGTNDSRVEYKTVEEECSVLSVREQAADNVSLHQLVSVVPGVSWVVEKRKVFIQAAGSLPQTCHCHGFFSLRLSVFFSLRADWFCSVVSLSTLRGFMKAVLFISQLHLFISFMPLVLKIGEVEMSCVSFKVNSSILTEGQKMHQMDKMHKLTFYTAGS